MIAAAKPLSVCMLPHAYIMMIDIMHVLNLGFGQCVTVVRARKKEASEKETHKGKKKLAL